MFKLISYKTNPLFISQYIMKHDRNIKLLIKYLVKARFQLCFPSKLSETVFQISGDNQSLPGIFYNILQHFCDESLRQLAEMTISFSIICLKIMT